MVDQTNITTPAKAPADRLEKLGRASLRRKPEGGPTELTARHKLLVDYQINGVQHRSLLQRVKRQKAVLDDAGQPVIRDVSPEPGEPLTLIESADLLRIRRRNARELSTLPIYQKYLAAEIQRFREGEKIASMHTIVAMRDEPGFGKAADRKVRLAAAGMILGEDVQRGGVTVNVNTGQQITAGIVVRLPPSVPQPAPLPARTIDHEDDKP